MAESKKKISVEEQTIDMLVTVLIFGGIVSILIPVIIQLLSGIGFWGAIKNIFWTVYAYYRFIATIASVLFLTGIIYCTVRIGQIRKEEALIYHYQPQSAAIMTPESEIKKHRNQKWANVEELIVSRNPSDWKLAIVEADVILDEMLSRMPYAGETIADKLKIIEKSDFNTIESAWEAHKIRNQIVHGGSGYSLTEHEAKRVIDLYRQVFEEFYFI